MLFIYLPLAMMNAVNMLETGESTLHLVVADSCKTVASMTLLSVLLYLADMFPHLPVCTL